MLKLIVFDCDGVMFDSKNLNKHFYNHLLAHFGYKEMDEEELDFVHIHNVLDSVAHIFRNYPETPVEKVHEYRLSLNYSDFLDYMEMESDLLYFLEQVKNDYKLAISTNRGDTMFTILETYDLKKYFGKVMTSTNAKRPKPAPDGMEEILEHFCVDNSEAIFIGDSRIDQLYAEASGVELIAFKNESLKAKYHVNNFTEILQLKPFIENS